jgi:hypothetical protein
VGWLKTHSCGIKNAGKFKPNEASWEFFIFSFGTPNTVHLYNPPLSVEKTNVDLSILIMFQTKVSRFNNFY